ncbi:unannotated protein [freshwater metagenome]|uniref:Unannotated protein n=1 Tax=freshwater metagenome TaxID=449393 RepID=A0A6J6YP34_9ZZZZ
MVWAWCDNFVEFKAWSFPSSWKQEVHVVSADDISFFIVSLILHICHGICLGETTHDLSFDDHWVNTDTAVINSNKLQYIPNACLGIDFNLCNVASKWPCEVWRIVVSDILQSWFHAIWHIAICSHCTILNCHATFLISTNVETAQLPFDIFFRYFK